MVKNIKIAPSLLAADYVRLGEEVHAVEAAGADLLHLDVMDGHFVPNISFGADVIAALRPHTSLYFDVHLMLSHPLDYLTVFKEAGADAITVHIEAIDDLNSALTQIKALDIEAGVAINPQTELDLIPTDCWSGIDRLIIMTVQPGFGGQKFIDLSEKITQAAHYKKQYNKDMEIVIDGGVNAQTAPIAIVAGGSTLVAGSAIFKTNNYKEAMTSLRGTAL